MHFNELAEQQSPLPLPKVPQRLVKRLRRAGHGVELRFSSIGRLVTPFIDFASN